MPYFVYILYSKNADSFYIGQTQDLSKRVNEHNSHSTPSTKMADDWELKYWEEFLTRSEAMTRESAIKRKKSRKYIEWLVIAKVG